MSKGMSFFAVAVALSAVLPLNGTADGARKPKGLMIMVDGLRADAVEESEMPNLRNLKDGKWQPGYQGACSLTAHTLYDARPSSAANHSAIATGVTAAKTGIYKNGETPKGNFAEWPSWLVRLVDARPETKALYTYSWSGDEKLSPHPKVRNLPLTSVVTNNWPVAGDYEANALTIPKIMASDDAPDAVLYFIDMTDWGGHRSGFYPYGKEYLLDLKIADRIIGDTIAAIASRPSFKDEDWMIMVTSDHGGYGPHHGIWGGQATTIPVVIAGRNISNGTIAGIPRNFDLAPTMLAHFGLDVKPMKLDGKVLNSTEEKASRPLKDGLAVYLPFDSGTPENRVANGISPELHGATVSGTDGGKFGKCLQVAEDAKRECGVCVKGSEKLQFENNGDFAIALWMRLDAPQKPQAPIVSNKDWNSGGNPGIVLIGARKTESVKKNGVCFNSALSDDRKRIDIGTFDIDYGKWVFYAVTRNSDGVLTFYQGNPDGKLYWIAENASSIKMETGFPFWIGQDGTGKCIVSLAGYIDDFALWTRPLARKDIRAIYEAGKKGEALATLLNK
ncbi:MAG: alkaline phosphatase family protein [Kiritimatiellae bacterium]|nr:alkaline phosphatase family protein [Kiritimatiellia bacterium]